MLTVGALAAGCHGRVLIPSSSGCGAHTAWRRSSPTPTRLNPFFFRVRCSLGTPCAMARGPSVLIPSSSGCGAHVGHLQCVRRAGVLIPSSSGCGAHRLPARLGTVRRLNPFFFRVRCSRGKRRGVLVWNGVLIPSSSGCGAHVKVALDDEQAVVLIPSSSGCGAHRTWRTSFFSQTVLIPSSSGCGAHDDGRIKR